MRFLAHATRSIRLVEHLEQALPQHAITATSPSISQHLSGMRTLFWMIPISVSLMVPAATSFIGGMRKPSS